MAESLNTICCVNETNGKTRTSVIPNLFFTAVMIISNFTPILSRNISPIVGLAIALLWILTAVTIKRPENVHLPRGISQWWGVYVFLVYFSCIIGHSSYSLNFFISKLPNYCIPFMMLTVMTKYNLQEKKQLWNIIVAVLLLNLVQNIIAGIYNPDYFKGTDKLDATAVDKLTNAGGTGFIAACLFTSAIWWIIFCTTSIKKNKRFYLVAVILSVYYITILNNRTTSLIILVFMIIGFFLVYGRKRNTSKRTVVITAALIIIVGYFAVPILDYVIGLFEESEHMAEAVTRLTDIMSVAEGEDIEDLREGSLAARYMLWMTSINSFTESVPNFIFGIGDDFSLSDFSSLLKSGIGRHSEFFDLAAEYGLIGLIIMYKFLQSTFRYYRSFCESERTRKMLSVFVIAFLLYSFVNLMPMLVIMSLLPLSLVLLKNHLL